MDTGLHFLDNARPLPVEEFVERRDRLARALVADSVDAFVVEPGVCSFLEEFPQIY